MTKSTSAPLLLADIGGTNARFALCPVASPPTDVLALDAADFPDLATAVAAYLERVQPATEPRRAIFAVACPVTGDCIRLTNSPWEFSIDGLRRRLGLDRLVTVNDFTALALSIPYLPRSALESVGGGQPVSEAPIAVIGPGTGLGVSGMVPVDGGWQALASEGGHVTLAAANAEESEIVAKAREMFGHVSAERLISGPGLVTLHEILAGLRQETPVGSTPEALGPEEITRRAIDGSSPICADVLELFCRWLGSIAGDLALTLGARGGVYVGGGIVPALGPAFAASGFRHRFEDKGRFSDYLCAIPTYVIRHETPALLGLAALAEEVLN